MVIYFFLLFFGNFLAQVEYERNSRLKFFCLFLGLCHPVLAKNNAGKRFFNFLNFLLFFWNFLAQVKYEQNSGLNFFLSFSTSLNPFRIEIMRKLTFLIFWILFLFFFLEFSSLGLVGTVFGTKFFFFLFLGQYILFWLKIAPQRGFLIFWIFLLFFWNFLAWVENEPNLGL